MKAKRIILRIDERIHDRVKKECEKRGRGISEVVRQLLEEWMESKNGD